MLNIIIYLISLLPIDSIHYNLNKKIDSIIEFSIKEKAFPGAQIIVLKDGLIVEENSNRDIFVSPKSEYTKKLISSVI